MAWLWWRYSAPMTRVLLIDEAHNVLTPAVAKMLAEGRSAGLEAVFAWQYSAQIRDEAIRSGVRSLLQSNLDLPHARVEGARSSPAWRWRSTPTASLSTRRSRNDCGSHPTTSSSSRSIGQSTSGSPTAFRAPGFLSHALPMEEVFDAARAEQHLAVQRERGGHHPEALRDPIGRLNDDDEGDTAQPATGPRKPIGNRPPAGGARVVSREAPGDGPGQQGTLMDVD
jgi:hypothetical protein